MTKSIAPLLAILVLGSGLALLPVGCAGTSTRESTGEYVDDASISARVKTEFVRDPVVKAFQVEVNTFKGTVQLSGFVDTAAQRARAEQIARNTPGVQNVANNITLK